MNAPRIVDDEIGQPIHETPWNQWQFYDSTTGEFVGRTFSGPKETLAENTLPGCEAVPADAVADPLSQRVDVASGEVVDYIPARPSEDHEWNLATKRWVLKPEVAARLAAREAAVQEIRRLETDEQPRPVREILLGIGVGAVDRLLRIERDIRRQRRIIREADGLAPSTAADDQEIEV